MSCIEIREIVQLLENEGELFRQAQKFSDALNIPSPISNQFLSQYRNGIITPYELLFGFLSRWTQANGKYATLQRLRRILSEIGLRSCSGRLRDWEHPHSPPAVLVGQMLPSRVQSIISRSVMKFGCKKAVLDFIGRKEELVKLHKYFGSKNGVLISGLGGIGKTELTKRFLEKNISVENRVVGTWFAGETSQTLRTSVEQLCHQLNVSVHDSHGKYLKMDVLLHNVQEALLSIHEMSKWVIVIDNVDNVYEEFETVAEELIQNLEDVFLMVTSRRTDIFPDQLVRLQVPQLKLQESMEFVKRSLDLDADYPDAPIMSLCVQLGNFPLALSQASAYIKQQRATDGDAYGVADYLEELTRSEIVGLSLPSRQYPKATIKVWNITINKLKEHEGDNGRVALSVLNIISLLNPDEIKFDFLQKMYAQCFFEIDVEKLQQAVRLLVSHSMIKRNEEGICVHRLVQLACRIKFSNSQRSDVPSSSTRVCRNLLPKFWSSFHSKEWENDKISHILSIWGHTCRDKELMLQHCVKAYEIHARLIGLRMYTTSMDFARDNYSTFQITFGENNRETLWFRFCAAKSQYECGNWEEAYQEYLKIHQIHASTFGSMDRRTIVTANSIIIVLHDLQRWEEGFEWCKKQLKTCATVFGTGNSRTLRSKNNLATFLDKLGWSDEAMIIHEEILDWRLNNKGDKHPDTLATMHNIAVGHMHQGNLRAARELFLKVLRLEEEVLGAQHTDLYITKSNLASTFEGLGDIENSLRLLNELLSSSERERGAEHPYTVDIRNRIIALNKSKLSFVPFPCIVC